MQMEEIKMTGCHLDFIAKYRRSIGRWQKPSSRWNCLERLKPDLRCLTIACLTILNLANTSLSVDLIFYLRQFGSVLSNHLKPKLSDSWIADDNCSIEAEDCRLFNKHFSTSRIQRAVCVSLSRLCSRGG